MFLLMETETLSILKIVSHQTRNHQVQKEYIDKTKTHKSET